MAHHTEHGDAVGAQEACDEDGGDDQEDDVQRRRVVERGMGVDRGNVAAGGDDAERGEREFNDVAGGGHGDGEHGGDVERDFQRVVAPVDVDDRQHDEV